MKRRWGNEKLRRVQWKEAMTEVARGELRRENCGQMSFGSNRVPRERGFGLGDGLLCETDRLLRSPGKTRDLTFKVVDVFLGFHEIVTGDLDFVHRTSKASGGLSL